MKRLMIFFAYAFAVAAANAAERDVFLLLGQSNMAGRGDLSGVERVSTERVEKLDRQDKWVEGVEPIHFDKSFAAGGLGASFARIVADRTPGVTIGLVPCAVGGSSLDEWMPGAKLYVEAVRRARIAAQGGKIRAILWHQGESDADSGRLQATYNERLRKMVASLRKDLGLDAKGVPFIYASIGAFPQAKYYAGNVALNREMRKAVTLIPNAHWIEAEDLTSNADLIHFNLRSLRSLGERYAKAYLSAVGRGAAGDGEQQKR